MSVRIINETPDPSVAKRVPCLNCGVTLEYVPADTRQWTKTDYAGGTSTYTVIECPKCQKEITVDIV